MGSHHGHGGKTSTATTSQQQKRPKYQKHGLQQLIRLITFGLVVAAVVKERRLPADQRTWHGVVAGFVPYDFRTPTFRRFRERVWDPDGENLVNPRVFGVGWTVNVGKVVKLVREKVAEDD